MPEGGSDDSPDAVGDKSNGCDSEKVISMTTTNFHHHPNFYTYFLDYKSSIYNEVMGKKIGRHSKTMEVELRAYPFDPTDTITILCILPNFTVSSNLNEIIKGVSVWIFQFFPQAHLH